MTVNKPVTKRRIFTFIFGFARPYLLPLIIGTLLYCSQSVMFPLMSSVLMGGITRAMELKAYSELFTSAVYVFGMIVLAMVMAFFGVVMYVCFTTKSTERLQTAMLRSFMHTSAEEQTHSGERLSMLNTDVESAQRLYGDSLAGLLFTLLPMVILSAVVFSMDWRIGIYTVALGSLSTIAQMLFAKPIAVISKAALETTAEAAKTISDIFSGGIIIRVFRLEERMLNVFGRDNKTLLKLAKRESGINRAQKVVSGVMDILTTGGVFVVGSILISHDKMTLTILMAIVALSSSTAFPLRKLARHGY